MSNPSWYDPHYYSPDLYGSNRTTPSDYYAPRDPYYDEKMILMVRELECLRNENEKLRKLLEVFIASTGCAIHNKEHLEKHVALKEAYEKYEFLLRILLGEEAIKIISKGIGKK